MDNAYVLTMPALVILLGTLGWFFIRRVLSQQDKEADARTIGIQEEFKEINVRLNQHGERVRAIEIEMERKVTLEELKELREEMRSYVHQSTETILGVLNSKHGV